MCMKYGLKLKENFIVTIIFTTKKDYKQVSISWQWTWLAPFQNIVNKFLSYIFAFSDTSISKDYLMKFVVSLASLITNYYKKTKRNY